MRQLFKSPSARPALWGVFALFVAVPAVVLAVVGMKAIAADAKERERQRTDQLSEVIGLSDAAIGGAFDRIRATGTWPSAPHQAITFEVDGNGVVAFPADRVFFSRFGVHSAGASPVAASETWASYEEARRRWRAGDRAALSTVTSTTLSDDDGFTPAGIPVAIVASSVSRIAKRDERAAFVPLVRATLTRLREGAWWLNVDQRRAYDAELRRLLAEMMQPAPPEDERLATLERVESVVRPFGAGPRPATIETIDERFGLGLVLWTTAQPSTSRRGLFFDAPGISRIVGDVLEPLLARQAAIAAIENRDGNRIWTLGSVGDHGIAAALTEVPGWRIRVSSAAGAVTPGRSWQAYGVVLLPMAVLGLGLVMTIRLVRSEIALSRRQAEFTAAVTHEFKSPITSLRLLTERIASGRVAVGPALDEYHEEITRETNRLEALVNRLLDARQIQAGRRPHVPVRASLSAIAADAIARFRSQAASRNIDLVLDRPAAPIELAVDRHAISDALDNLIDNAIKYSPPGTAVTVTLRQDNGSAECSVSDQGSGIHRDDLPHVFEPYYRGRLGDRESVRGTGLGLALVHAAATAHGGTVEVTSKAGQGSCFTLRLPMEHA